MSADGSVECDVRHALAFSGDDVSYRSGGDLGEDVSVVESKIAGARGLERSPDGNRLLIVEWA